MSSVSAPSSVVMSCIHVKLDVLVARPSIFGISKGIALLNVARDAA